jgi:hypothetical protein
MPACSGKKNRGRSTSTPSHRRSRYTNFAFAGSFTAVYAAADVIPGALERREGFLHPAPLGRPAGDRIVELPAAFDQIAADGRVVGPLHLVDGDAVGVERQRALDARVPVLMRFAEHAGPCMPGRQKPRRAAAEVDEVETASGQRGLRGEQVEILFDLARVSIDVHAEAAEVASLTAERDVEIQA